MKSKGRSDDVENQRWGRRIMRDTGEYLLSSAEEEITWKAERKCHRKNLMAEEATAMRSAMKIETQRKRRKVFRRGTRIINIGIVFPNLHGHIPFFFSVSF